MGLKVLLTPVNSENVSPSTVEELCWTSPSMRTGPRWLLSVHIIDNILETESFMLLFKSAAVVFSI